MAETREFPLGPAFADGPANASVQARKRRIEMKAVREFLKDEQGASMAEYAMLLALIAVATIGAVQALRNQIIAVFNTSASTMGSAQ